MTLEQQESAREDFGSAAQEKNGLSLVSLHQDGKGNGGNDKNLEDDNLLLSKPVDEIRMNDFVGGSLDEFTANRFVEPYLGLQDKVNDMIASKGYSMPGFPRMTEHFAKLYDLDPKLDEAKAMEKMTPQETRVLGHLQDARNQILMDYMSYRQTNPIKESQKTNAEFLKDSNARVLSENEIKPLLNGLNKRQAADALEVMRLEIEAKAGKAFMMATPNAAYGRPEHWEMFGQRSWYKPTNPDVKLSQVEQSNKDLLLRMERQMRGVNV